MMLNVTVCGDAQIAHSIAAVCAWRGYVVRVLAKTPRQWCDRLTACLPDNSAVSGRIENVADEPRSVVRKADVLFICVRQADMAETLEQISPYVRQDTLVGAAPGFGGFGLLARKVMPKVRTFFGTQRIPFVVRDYLPGRVVQIGGIRRQTFIGTIPARRARVTTELLAEVLGVPTVPMSHFFNVELSPSNSIVNPARLYALFGPEAKRQPRPEEEFFSDWDMAASRMLLALDRELQEGRRHIPRDTSFVAPILFQYDANDARTLTYRIRNLRALAGRRVPCRNCNDKTILDLQTTYLEDDIDYGLRVIRDILQLAGADTPIMNRILEWRMALVRLCKARRRTPVSHAVAGYKTIELLASALD